MTRETPGEAREAIDSLLASLRGMHASVYRRAIDAAPSSEVQADVDRLLRELGLDEALDPEHREAFYTIVTRNPRDGGERRL